MNIGVSYRELFRYDPSVLEEHLGKVNADIWEKNDFRQTAFEVHRRTKSIVYVWSHPSDDEYAAIETHIDRTEPLHVEVWKAAMKIRDYYSAAATITKLMLAKLSPRSVIREHYDGGNLARIHRCHLPIITNAACTFLIDGIPHHFGPTAVIEINNQLLHGFVNDSDEDRVHLICDVLAPR
jgi:Aspartyl/Asparaginyl beta-hydroxylase